MKKVRCINELGFENRLKHNDIYTVTKEIKGRYILKEIGEAYEFGVERFQEVTEDTKELNIIEAMKMPVGTEFKVIFNGEQIENNTMIIYRSLEGDNERKHMDWKCHPQDTFMRPYDFLINGTFIPVQKPVKGIKAITSGKKIKVDHYITRGIYEFNDYMDFNIMCRYLYNFENSEVTKIINEGLWYVKED